VIGAFPPQITDVRLDAERDRAVSYDGRVPRTTDWRYSLTFDVQIDEKTYMDLAAEFAKNGWRGPGTAQILGALVMNLQNGRR
jgi:hypothetical protein